MVLDNQDLLSQLAFKYETDKCPQIKHPFTPFYHSLLQDKRQAFKKVLEIGIGYREMALPWRSYRTGASLFMWQDYFPNAQIYGADNNPDTLIQDIRIRSLLCDQTDHASLVNLIGQTGADLDLVIDDGSHFKQDQIFTCQTLMPIINKNVIYIIEDVVFSTTIPKALSQYNCWVPDLAGKFKDDKVIVVSNRD